MTLPTLHLAEAIHVERNVVVELALIPHVREEGKYPCNIIQPKETLNFQLSTFPRGYINLQ